MKVRNLLYAVAFLGSVATNAVGANAANVPLGKWQMENGRVTVEVSYCGEPRVCVTIVDLAKRLDSNGQPRIDEDNPNPALRSRPLIGLQIISGMVPDGTNRWKGQIYSYKDGKTYRSTAVLKGDVLFVKGYWGPFSKKMNFVRVK